jgi:CBS domain containing-hemolysin-like protein
MSFTEEIPETGAEIRGQGYIFTVVEVSQTRIEKIRVLCVEDEE